MEKWRDIPGYEGIYEASTEGRIRSSEGKTTSNARYSVRHWKQRIIKQKHQARSTGKKDARVCLWKDGKENTHLVSRLIAMAWCAGYADGMTVNHIDGNPENNHADNLEWVTRRENIQKAYADGLYVGKACVLFAEDGSAKHFNSMSEASRYLGRSDGYVSEAIKKGRRYIHGSVLRDS